ncbi:hypothetical protein [Geomonas agri]|nr:hypothetical protein [Geomonas agri]
MIVLLLSLIFVFIYRRVERNTLGKNLALVAMGMEVIVGGWWDVQA